MKVHAESRRTWGRAFTSPAVKKYEPIVIRRVAQLVDELKARALATGSRSATVDISHYVNCFS